MVAPGGWVVCVVALGGTCVVAPGGPCMVAPGDGGHAWLLPGGHAWLLPGGGMHGPRSDDYKGCGQGWPRSDVKRRGER